MDYMLTSLILGNSRQHRSVCANTISSWLRKVLCIAKAHISLSSVLGATTSAILVASVSLISIPKAGDWASISTLVRHYFSTCITTTDQQQDSVQNAVLGLSE